MTSWTASTQVRTARPKTKHHMPANLTFYAISNFYVVAKSCKI